MQMVCCTQFGSHTPSGCDWTDEVGGAKQHTHSCLKHPWKCQYCGFASTYDVEVDLDHNIMKNIAHIIQHFVPTNVRLVPYLAVMSKNISPNVLLN